MPSIFFSWRTTYKILVRPLLAVVVRGNDSDSPQPSQRSSALGRVAYPSVSQKRRSRKQLGTRLGTRADSMDPTTMRAMQNASPHEHKKSNDRLTAATPLDRFALQGIAPGITSALVAGS